MRYRYKTGANGKPEKKAVIYTCDEHGINFANVDGEAVSIIRKLKSAGFDSYIVGGAVRDLILGKKPKDFDIVSAASPGRIKKLFRNSRIIGRRFRLVHVYSGERIFEVSTFRSLKDGHTSNTFGTIEEDVQRRDFTLNALFYDPQQQIVVDYVGGMDDIKKKQIKPIINLNDIFTDDPVRMIRACKYSAISGFSMPVNLKKKITAQSNLLLNISPSRLTEEMFKIINSDKAAVIVESLEKSGLYNYLQPGACALMKKSADFRKKYYESLSKLKGAENKRGEALGALFKDYLDTTCEWKPGSTENFKEICKDARYFIMPINPPRFDFHYSVKKFLSSKGITIKRVLLKPAAEEAPTAVKRKRRRRKKNKNITQ
ncbi:MAG: polynucleotide adenylyltransferase PcnB [Treponema sp.]|nr:polynucleotide adenylyltransferase PcnB [Treponema sp.]MCL2237098.1 polynucleotide adenylyltransferase PcnB [Treponema sp.]